MNIDADDQESESAGPGQQAGQGSTEASSGAIDIARLTALVYRLMVDELRLENARVARRNT